MARQLDIRRTQPMAAFPSPERLARFSTRRPWLVVGIWIAVLVAGLASASTIGGVVTNTTTNYQSTDSRTADDELAAQLYGKVPGQETIVVQSPTRTVDDPAFQQVVTGL